MTTQRPAALFFAIFCAALVCLPSNGRAQDQSHPAVQRVISYLTYAMGQDWPKSAALIREKSLIGLRDRFIARIGNAPTVQDELDMCRALDCSNLDAVKELDPTDFYIRYHNGIQKAYKVSPEKLKTIMNSKQVKLISFGEETIGEGTPQEEKLAHVLVRTRHKNGTKLISSLELVNMVFEDGQWLVTMEAMRAIVRDDGGTASATTTPKK